MELMMALPLSLFIALLITENYGYGYWMISRPVFAGPLIGLIMGDLPTGLFVGGTVELMYMGVLPIGGSVPPNAQIAGILSTVFAITSGGNPEVGIALALPIGVLAQLMIMMAWNVNIILVHGADKYLLAGDYKKVEKKHLMGLLVFLVIFFVTTFLAVFFGSEWVNSLVTAMPDVLTDGLKVASGILPAVGMAMLLKMMNFKRYWPFFLIGFVFAAWLQLPVLAVSVAAVGIVFALNAVMAPKASSDGFDDEFEDDAEDEEADEVPRLLDMKILKKTFIRSFFFMTSINYERYESLGFCYAMIPALRVLYPDPEDFKAAMSRENEFFNCHPYTGNAVLGVALALEEQKALGKPITEEVISSTKTALMGPLSSIGDSVFKAMFMSIFAAIGASLALEGNALGPIVFIVPNVALNIVSRWLFVRYGYEWGTKLVVRMKSSSLLDRFVEGATIVGMMAVSAMITSFVKLSIPLTFSFGGAEIAPQAILDSLVPSMLPLLLVMGFYGIMVKNKKGMYLCIILSFALGICGKAIGLF